MEVQLVPKSAIVLYESEDKNSSDIVAFRVNPFTGLLTSPGRISRELIGLLRRITGKKKSFTQTSLLPKGAIASTDSYVLVYLPSQIRTITIMAEQRKLLFPSMLCLCEMEADTPSLQAWYCKNDEIFENTDKEILAPASFLNTDNQGNVCLGSVSQYLKKPTSMKDFADQLLYLHFQAPFTEWRCEKNKILIDLMEAAVKSKAAFKLHRVWKHIEKHTPIEQWTSVKQIIEKS